MADDQSPTGQQKDGGNAGQNAGQNDENKEQTSQEVSATDLLSLWGGAAGSSAKPTPSTPKPPPPPPPSPLPPVSKPVSPPTPTPTPTPAPAPVPKPPPTTPLPKPALPPVPFPSPQQPQPPSPKPPPQERRPESVDWFKNTAVTPQSTPPPASEMIPTPKSDITPKPSSPPPPPPQTKSQPKPEIKPEAKLKEEQKEKALEGELIDDIPFKKPEQESGPKPTPAPKPQPKPAPKPVPKPVPKSEPAVAGIPDITAEVLDEKEGIGEQIDELLQELNLSRKHIFMGLGCIVLVIVLIIGGVAGYRYYKNHKDDSVAVTPPSVENQPDDVGANTDIDAGISEDTDADTDATGIDATSDIGSDLSDSAGFEGDTGILSTVSIGTETENVAPLSHYIFTFRRLQNAYETDIDEILNKTTDRRARLQAHLSLMHKLYDESTVILQDIGAQLDSIKNTYEPLKQKQEIADANFFEQLNALNAQTADDILNDFIEASRETVMLKARFKALQKVQSFYEVALPKVARLIRDIELNKEALISGIKIYDVRGSDLNLILPVVGEEGKTAREKLSDGATVPNDSVNVPTIPFIPVHPTEVKTGGTDYITQPGGGFQ